LRKKKDPRVATNVLEWLRAACASHAWEALAVYRKRGAHSWPLTASDEDDLVNQLDAGGHFVALPKEPAALANIIEVSIVDFLIEQLKAMPGAEYTRGTERGYPDLEVGGAAYGGGYHAIDVKVAQLARNGRDTQSRVTLYTGNTFFRWPTLPWGGTFRPFQEYESNLVVLALYRLNPSLHTRVENLELIVQEAWRIGSKQRSSTTREYIGGITSVNALRNGNGEFGTINEFYEYWRAFPFKMSRQVEKQLQKLLSAPAREKEELAKRAAKSEVTRLKAEERERKAEAAAEIKRLRVEERRRVAAERGATPGFQFDEPSSGPTEPNP
jgi:hypothetical protein